MKLEDVRAEIRPRAPWESIDLGCAIARQYIKPLWKAWLVTIVPVWIVLAVLLFDHPFIFILLVWWLKPLGDRVLLFVVSRALFGAVPSVKQILKAWPKMMVKNLWSALVVRRFSPSRSLSLPVSELEGLKGKSYRNRIGLLEVNGGEGAAIATMVGLFLEVVAFLSCVLFVISMMPSQVSEMWMLAIDEFFSQDDWSGISKGLLWTSAIVWMLAITLMEPFYICAGFALYLNSRTLTEGWDIELAFKRMTARLERMKSGVQKVVNLMLIVAVSIGYWASAHVVHASTSIEQVMESEDFTIYKKVENVPVDKESSSWNWNWDWSWDLGFSGMASSFANVLFYGIVTALIIGIGYLIYKNRHLLSGMKDSMPSLPETKPKTSEIMGLDVSPESLPDDIVQSARAAWQSGDLQLSLSLLYRGSIAWMINHENLPIEESDTEGDCLRHVEAGSVSENASYFKQLTHAWTGLAYGKLAPTDVVMEDLCGQWPFVNNKPERSAS